MTNNEEIPLFIRIMFITLAILVTVVAIGSIIMILVELATQQDLGIKTVPCYDKYNNVINGVNCTEDVKCGFITNLFKECLIK